MMDKQSIMYRKSQIFHCETIFGQPGLCEKYIHNINDITVQGHLSKNYLMREIIA